MNYNLDAEATLVVTEEEAGLGCIKKVQLNDEILELKVPANTRHKQKLRLRSKGHYQPLTGRRGDLYLTILIDKKEQVAKIELERNHFVSNANTTQKQALASVVGIALVIGLGALAQYIGETREYTTSESAKSVRLGDSEGSDGNQVSSQVSSKGHTSKDDADSSQTSQDEAENTNTELQPINGEYADSEWDDKSITEESLPKLCKGGIWGNSVQRTDNGYIKNIFRARMIGGSTSLRDYTRLRKWFAENCPEGW